MARYLAAASARAVRGTSTAPPLRFDPLQRLFARSSGLVSQVYLTRLASVFRFSQPLGALIRPVPTGLVSCQIRSWGSPSRAFLLPHSRTPSPAPFPSWR